MKFDKMLLSMQVSEEYEWMEWMEKIPYLQFPSHWQVKVIPPFAGAIARFLIRTPDLPEGERLSVYLDCYNQLGFSQGPYWEVYPVVDDTFRCGMHETDELITAIAMGLDHLRNGKNV